MVKFFFAAATIFLVMTAGGDFVPGHLEARPRGDFEPAARLNPSVLGLSLPERAEFGAA
jgi:hypothetical protein